MSGAHEDWVHYWLPWCFEVGDYKLCCSIKEKPRDTYHIAIVEKGRELEGHELKAGVDEWRVPFDFAEELRLKYFPRMVEAVERAERYRR